MDSKAETQGLEPCKSSGSSKYRQP